MVSLSHVAGDVAEAVLYFEDRDSAVKKLRRKFKRFIEAGGGNCEKLKDDNGNMYFDESEVPLIKTILTQLAEDNGFAGKFIKKNGQVDYLNDAHDLIQEVINTMEKDGNKENEIKANVNTLDRLFQLSFRSEIENCHKLVDGIALNLMPYPYTHQMIFVQRFTEFLKKEFALTVTEAIFNTGELGEFLQKAKELGEIDDVSDLYGDRDDEIASEYRQRDASVVEFLMTHPEIRNYVEAKVGVTIDKIWKLDSDLDSFGK